MTTNTNLDKYRPKLKLAEVITFITNHPGLAIFLVYATIAIAGFVYLVNSIPILI
jgi:hypothetical protein